MNEIQQKALSDKAVIALYREFNEAPPMDSPAYKAYIRTIDDASTINCSFVATFTPRKKAENNQKS